MNRQGPLNLLLVADEDAQAEMISKHLQGIEYIEIKFERVASLFESENKLRGGVYDILLLDLHLSDGFLKQTIRDVVNKFPNLPIIVLSRCDEKDLVKKTIHEGAQDFICTSAITPELLLRSIISAMERKNSQVSLVEREILKTKFLESSLDAIVSMDSYGRILEFNHVAEEIFGYRREDVIGCNVSSLIIPERLRMRHEIGIEKYLRTGMSTILGRRIEMQALRSDGTEFPAELSVAAFSLNGKQLFTSFIRDMTAKKRFEEELCAAKELAESANKAKSAFLANMSHEIRTPLGVILGFAELLIDPSVSIKDKVKYAATIKRSGELLSQIISDILDLSKIESGKLDIEMKEVYLNEVIDDIRKITSSMAHKKGIDFYFQMDSTVPEVIVTDSLRLRQILLNVIGNAIKFTNIGYVNVDVNCLERTNENCRIEFVIADTGSGILADQVRKLFSPFSQLEVSTKRKFGGTGLGLVLSKNLAKLLKGDVYLRHSEFGKGSTFVVEIDSGTVAVENNIVRRSIAEHLSIQQDFDLTGVRILLAEDSPDNQILFQSVLQIAGATVDLANSGQDAVNLFKNNHYDLLLLDIQMPIMDGYEAAICIRRMGYLGPIIALTAHATIDEKKFRMTAGFDAHLTKPIERKKLIEQVFYFSKITTDRHKVKNRELVVV